MKTVQRKWFRLMELGIDHQLLNVLSKLKVIKNKTFLQYCYESHFALSKYRYEKQLKKSRSEARTFSTTLRGPKQIKPTKARK